MIPCLLDILIQDTRLTNNDKYFKTQFNFNDRNESYRKLNLLYENANRQNSERHCSLQISTQFKSFQLYAHCSSIYSLYKC